MLQCQSDNLMLFSEVALLQEQVYLKLNCSYILSAPYETLLSSKLLQVTFSISK